MEEVINDPAYAVAAFPTEAQASSRDEVLPELETPQTDANLYLTLGDSNENDESGSMSDVSESFDPRGLSKDGNEQQDLFKELEEFFDKPFSQGKISSASTTSTPTETKYETNGDEKSSDSQTVLWHEGSDADPEPFTPVTVPAVDVGDGLYF